MVDDDPPPSETDRSATTPLGHHVVSVLRLAAISLVVVGFSGWVIDHGGEIALESPFTIAFGVGVACAFASIYLGIFLADGGD
ncbi:hypothetical protein EA462_03430 [Natrarchaeobius halalkaliphilus]|uniref:Uncharacterized protein n=1 Tax=Natrarchaeobius halalkaliphilus TaxID=1679091 RepID=A0A3N6MGY9_9EURY|nr:hypothetical protein [Natrarchaeobius halalkaliphilus]RQG93256.1 hypothetical protein EA462_03430 [Natrarchaeobius halalkaliphilus]